MIKVAIAEDCKSERELLESYINRYDDSISVSLFSNGSRLLDGYSPIYDILFLDIEMPHLDGMSLAKKIREIDSTVTIVFITNLAKMAIKGYEVQAFDFIVKPVSYDTFILKMNRIMESLKHKRGKEILIHSERNLARADVLDILYVEIMSHRIVYHTLKGDIPSYGTLKSVEDMIDDPLFVKCNQCYLVNLRHVQAIEGNEVIVGEDRLLISQPKREGFVAALASYLCDL